MNRGRRTKARTRDVADRLILIGYRGTGKTTVGRLIAARLGWAFVDSDDQVEAATGQTIAGLFASEGEEGFRNREAAVLAELCSRDRVVLATGGGAVLRAENRERLRAAGFVVWLTAPAEVIGQRLHNDPLSGHRRPNLTAAGGLDEIRTLLAARAPLYRDLADLTVETHTRSPEAVADAILSAWTGGCSRLSSCGAPGSSSSGWPSGRS